MPRHVKVALAVLALASIAACQARYRPAENGEDAVGHTRQADRWNEAHGAHLVAWIDGLHGPESARYDPERDAWYISNMNGFGSVKDGNGYIVVADAANPGQSRILAEGGRHGVVLDAPKGLAISGDTLWAADITVLRGFDRRDGRPVANIDLAPQGAVLLNDVDVGPDGTVYVTDTGIEMSPKGVLYKGGDKIFAIGAGHAVRVIASGPALHRPNGITWDSSGRRLVVVSFDPFHSQVYALKPGDTTRTILGEGIGQFDGVEPFGDGRWLVTSWADSSIHVIGPGGRDERMIRDLWAPADLGVDTKRHRIGVPVGMKDRVEFYQLSEQVAAR